MTKQQKRNRAHQLCRLILRDLIVGRFGSIKFDGDERRELVGSVEKLADEIDDATAKRISEILELLENGLEYVSSEAPDLKCVRLHWVTGRDIQYFLDQAS